MSEWISVADKLPDKDVLVLCIGKRGGMFLGYPDYCCDGGRAYVYVPNDKGCRYATHWMPLPEAPKEEV